MKKILIPLLVLVMLCVSLTALAEGGSEITLKLNTSKLTVYAADDPRLSGMIAEGNTLPVILLSAKKAVKLQVDVQPKSVRNKKINLAVDNASVVRVKGNSVTGLNPGETVLTIASQQDPSATLQYRLVVVQPVKRVNLSAPSKTLGIGETMALKASFVPENATNTLLTWTSGNPQIATVDENGVVTGVKRGSTRITVMTADGSKIRANVNVQVTQGAQEIRLDKTDFTVATGRNAVVKATVLPQDTNNKNVVWSSSDERIATVNAKGRVTGVALGDCEIICTSKENGAVQAKATVHVQQPANSIAFGPVPAVYTGETAQLTWSISPENVSNSSVLLTSSNPKILTVSNDGTVTGVSGGVATVTIRTADGSNRQAKVKVKVMQHVTGVHMRRHVAYIDLNETNSTRAVIEPEKAKNINNRIIWEIADPSVAAVKQNPKEANKVDITGLSYGETTLFATTEDGGFQTSMQVKVGDYENSLRLTNAYVSGADAHLTVQNISDLTITSITAEVTVLDADGNKVPCNSRDPDKPFQMVYKRTLGPGESTKDGGWKTVNFMLPDSLTVSTYVIKVTEFQIDGDWVKLIRKKFQPTKKCPVHI